MQGTMAHGATCSRRLFSCSGMSQSVAALGCLVVGRPVTRALLAVVMLRTPLHKGNNGKLQAITVSQPSTPTLVQGMHASALAESVPNNHPCMDHNSKDAVNRQCGSTPQCDIPLLLGRHSACCDPGRACTKNSNANDEHGRRSHCTHVTRIVYESHPSVSVEGIYTVPSRAENLAAHLRACLVANHSSSITGDPPAEATPRPAGFGTRLTVRKD